MAVQISDKAAAAGVGVAFFSIEMTKEEILQRMACARAGVDLHKFRSGRLQPDEMNRMEAALRELASLQLMISKKVRRTVSGISAAVRRLRNTRDIRLVVVDYLQLLEHPGRNDNRVQEITEISAGLKLMAREFGIPIVALCQLNRASETKKRPPRASDRGNPGLLSRMLMSSFCCTGQE